MKFWAASLLFINIFVTGSKVALTETASYYPGYGYFKNIGIPKAKRLQATAAAAQLNSMIRIAGGEPAELGEFIYQVGLIISLFDEDSNGVCGGSLISNQRVLTAAHCWYDGYHQGYAMRVVLGTTNVYSEDAVTQDTHFVRMHPSYIASSGTNDIALVQLATVTFTDNIGPIALPSGSDLEETFEGYEVIATGYGRETEDTSVPVTYDLRQLRLTVISNERCAELQERAVPPTALCASAADGSNVCDGDSGGPLTTTGSESARIQIGIISHGTLTDGGCESGIPAIYTRVAPFVPWINEHM